LLARRDGTRVGAARRMERGTGAGVRRTRERLSVFSARRRIRSGPPSVGGRRGVRTGGRRGDDDRAHRRYARGARRAVAAAQGVAGRMSRVAVVGAGTMGNGIAHVFAQHGWETMLVDVSAEQLDRAVKTIDANLDRQVKKGTLAADQKDATLGRIRTDTKLDGAGKAELVVEAAAENPEAVDTVMKLGMSHPLGPLALADLIGLDVCLAILEVLHRDLGDDKYRPCPLLRKLVAAGRLGRKSGRGFHEYRG